MYQLKVEFFKSTNCYPFAYFAKQEFSYIYTSDAFGLNQLHAMW